MSSPAELVDKDCCFNAGDIGLIEDAGISAVIFPLDMKDFLEASLVVPLQTLEVLLITRFHIQKGV